MFVIKRFCKNYDEYHLDDAVSADVISYIFETKDDALEFIENTEVPGLISDYAQSSDDEPDIFDNIEWDADNLVFSVDDSLVFEYEIVEVTTYNK